MLYSAVLGLDQSAQNIFLCRNIDQYSVEPVRGVVKTWRRGLLFCTRVDQVRHNEMVICLQVITATMIWGIPDDSAQMIKNNGNDKQL